MEGLFDNPFIIITLIVFIFIRVFNALREKSKDGRPFQLNTPPPDVPPADPGTF
jgi:large-conductance mechanosensitive channel